MTATPSAPTGPARHTPWSRTAATCTLVLTGLQVDLLVRGAAPQAYLAVVLALCAATAGLAGVGVAVRNCVVSRVVAVTVAVGAVAAVALLTTVGTPGSTGAVSVGGTAAVAVALGLAVPALVAADAARRSVRRVRCRAAGPGPVPSSGADSRAARGGRPRHCADAGPCVGA